MNWTGKCPCCGANIELRARLCRRATASSIPIDRDLEKTVRASIDKLVSNGASMRRISSQSGVSVATISRIYRGIGSLSMSTARKLAATLEVKG